MKVFIWNHSEVCINPETVFNYKHKKTEVKILLAEHEGMWAHSEVIILNNGGSTGLPNQRVMFDSKSLAINTGIEATERSLKYQIKHWPENKQAATAALKALTTYKQSISEKNTASVPVKKPDKKNKKKGLAALIGDTQSKKSTPKLGRGLSALLDDTEDVDTDKLINIGECSIGDIVRFPLSTLEQTITEKTPHYVATKAKTGSGGPGTAQRDHKTSVIVIKKAPIKNIAETKRDLAKTLKKAKTEPMTAKLFKEVKDKFAAVHNATERLDKAVDEKLNSLPQTHSSSHFGKDRTDRQRIKRKVQRWKDGFAELPKLEQDLIFAEINSIYKPNNP